MDTLEEANNRLLLRRKSLGANMQTSRNLPIPTIGQLREVYRKEPRGCVRCGAITTEGMCDPCNAKMERDRYEEGKRRWLYLRSSKKDNFDAYIKACGVPRIFQNKKDTIDETGSVFITGSCGTGKSYASASIIRRFVKNLHCGHFIPPFKNTPIFENVPELLIKIRAVFNNSSQTEEEMLRRYLDTPLLVLDDLGAEKTTPWALQSLYVILNKRGSELRQTIVTSNLSLDEMGDVLSDRIASRIKGMCKVVVMNGKDRRLA